jgi:putative ABC transport system substrate-binding protein
MNNRRKLLVAIGMSALGAPLASFAQKQGKVWRIGFLWETDHSAVEQYRDVFKAGMRELGYVEGRDYAIEQRSAQADLARLPALAAELLSLKVDVIVSSTNPAAIAARNATREIPILTAAASDPVGSGLAASLRRPGGNVTGLTTGVASDLYSKRLDLLRQILPGMRRVGFLYNPDNAANTQGLRQFESDCGKLKFKSVRAPLRKAEEIGAAFNTLQRDKAQGVIVTPASTNLAWRESIIEQAAKHRLPAVYGQSLFAESGGLISYAANFPDLYRRAATYADKIFKGAKPGDLPIEQPLKFETVINLKTAKALGVTIPQSLLISADKLIE